ncbi:MAG: hypothetical protein K9L75_00405 [Spirochaetia bacterium]|nr:hypothetical protein [Spirochaetia bacterium]
MSKKTLTILSSLGVLIFISAIVFFSIKYINLISYYNNFTNIPKKDVFITLELVLPFLLAAFILFGIVLTSRQSDLNKTSKITNEEVEVSSTAKQQNMFSGNDSIASFKGTHFFTETADEELKNSRVDNLQNRDYKNTDTSSSKSKIQNSKGEKSEYSEQKNNSLFNLSSLQNALIKENEEYKDYIKIQPDESKQGIKENSNSTNDEKNTKNIDNQENSDTFLANLNINYHDFTPVNLQSDDSVQKQQDNDKNSSTQFFERLSQEVSYSIENGYDLSLILIKIEPKYYKSDFEVFKEEINKHFSSSSFVYTFLYETFAIILPFHNYSETLDIIKDFYICLKDNFIKRGTTFFAGATATFRRQIDPDTFLYEAEISLNKALEEENFCIIGFKANIEKYNQYYS